MMLGDHRNWHPLSSLKVAYDRGAPEAMTALGWLDIQGRYLIEQWLGLGCEQRTKVSLGRELGLRPYKLDKALYRARWALQKPSERSRVLRPFDPEAKQQETE